MRTRRLRLLVVLTAALISMTLNLLSAGLTHDRAASAERSVTVAQDGE